MRIAILGGTGNLGPGLALRWAHAGHEVIIGSREAGKAQAVADDLNVELPGAGIHGLANENAVKLAELCVLTVNQEAHQPALEGLKDALQGKLLVDATARLSFPDLTPPSAPSAAQIAQAILGDGVRVVAAFQTVPAAGLRANPTEPLDSDVLVCADNDEAATLVIGLARAAGLQAYYAGGLDKSIVVEGLTSLLVTMNKHYRSRHGTIRVAGLPTED